MIGASALAQHAVALFYTAATARYHFLTWLLTMLVVMVWFQRMGVNLMSQRYPALFQAFCPAPLVATACIWARRAAKSIGMNDKPTGIANGLTNYGDRDFSLYLRRSFAQSMGYSRAMLEKPVVGIAFTPSGFNNCHRHFPELLDAVKRGVLTAGALPIEFPTISLGEVFLNPTSLKFRNLMSIDTEEMVRAQPMDAVVLMGGCDKTVPAQLMGAVSAGKPAVMLVGGPMMTGRHRGERLGACTDCRRFWAQYRAGKVDDTEISEVEGKLATTAGTCAVMGTASTMACIAEALGMILPGTAAIPAVHADRLRAAEATGAAAVKLIGSQLTPDRIVNKQSVENALRVLLAIGGSTNAVIHLTAIAGRAGIPVSLQRLNELSDTTPVLVNLKPVGNGYMEDFFAAGGMGALLRELKDLLHLDCMTVTGETLGERLAHEGAGWIDRTIIAERISPLEPQGGLVALFGNLAPQGAILKRSAADANLFEHEGRAVVFSSLEDLAARIDDPKLDVGCQRHSRFAKLGPAFDFGYAGSRLSADPEEACHQRCQGHGASFRCPHERHRFRYHCIARHPRQRLRRPTRYRADRRSHSALGQTETNRLASRRCRAQAARCRIQAVCPAAFARLCTIVCAGDPRRRPRL